MHHHNGPHDEQWPLDSLDDFLKSSVNESFGNSWNCRDILLDALCCMTHLRCHALENIWIVALKAFPNTESDVDFSQLSDTTSSKFTVASVGELLPAYFLKVIILCSFIISILMALSYRWFSIFAE